MESPTVFSDLLIEHLHDGVIGIDSEHRITLLNQRAEALFGRMRDELLGQPLDLLLPQWIQANHREHVRGFLSQPVRARAMREGQPVEAIGADGNPLFVEATIVQTADFSTETVAVAVFRDVTEQQWIRHTLKQAARIFDSAREGITVTDAEKRILTVNQAFTDITGYTEDEVRGQTPAVLQSGRQDKGFYEAMWRTIRETGQWQGEIWNRRKSGEIYPEWLTISAVPDEQGRVLNYVGVFTDIAPIHQAETRLEEISNFDPITSLGNWQWLHGHLEHALERTRSRQTSGALLLMNLDGFRLVNESLGRAAGDLVLQQIAGRLRIGLDEPVMIARTRDDEFAALVTDISTTDDLDALAKRIKTLIEETVELPDGHEVRTSATIGISVFPADGGDAHTIMQAADTALHRARDDGPRGGYCFYAAAQTRRARARADLERQLYRAVERKEFIAFYQPVVGISDGSIVGAEALVRWSHPGRGLISPAEFIDVAEATGLIEPIGNQILASACRDAAAWNASGFSNMSLAVNLSAHQFRSGDLLAHVERVLAETGLPADRLTLEITETTLMEYAPRVAATVSGLHQRGIRLAIDDFGTGYSSLAYLKRFNADILKVDRSFIRALPADRDSGQIVKAILALADGLNMDVVIEGIETEAQRLFLQQLGANRFQGFLASPPVSAERFTELLNTSDTMLRHAPG